jgi:hypothetical protein
VGGLATLTNENGKSQWGVTLASLWLGRRMLVRITGEERLGWRKGYGDLALSLSLSLSLSLLAFLRGLWQEKGRELGVGRFEDCRILSASLAFLNGGWSLQNPTLTL